MTRRLQFEPLERRSLCAIAAFAVNLYEDAGGVPGQLIANDTVEVGDTFFVEIMVQEHDPIRAGLAGVALDFAWDSNVFQEIDSPFDPSKIITPHLPHIWGGTLDNEAGTIENLAGSAILSMNFGRAIGNVVPERFALLHFRATMAAEDSLISMDQGSSRIATVPVSSLGAASLRFENQSITVVAKSAAEFVGPLPVDEYFRTFETAGEIQSPCQGGLV